MAQDMLDRIIGEIRERKLAAKAAYEESQQLERALAALNGSAVTARPAAKRRPRRRAKPAEPA
jgi:hypothetical protein